MDAVAHMTSPDDLSRLIDLCEQRVGDGWTADPTVDEPPLEHGGPEPRREAGTGRGIKGNRGQFVESPTRAEWMNLGNRAARRLMLLLNDESEVAL